jgi:hypothetical protein
METRFPRKHGTMEACFNRKKYGTKIEYGTKGIK